MTAPPLFPQIVATIRMNRKAIWEKLFFVHVAFGLTTYTVYKIPVTDKDRQASKTLNPWQPADH